MKFSEALGRALSGVDAENWKGRLDSLHEQHGTWKAVAGHLGVDKRTVERWRFGYTDKQGNRRQIADKTVKDSVVPKISKGWGSDRKAQVQAVDWKGLSMAGTMQVGNYPPRRQAVHVGLYMTPGSIAAIGEAYLKNDAGAVDDAMNRCLSEDYTMNGDTRMVDVDKLEF